MTAGKKGAASRSEASRDAARIVAASFFMQLGFQATYFVGIIGCATYVLGADAFAVSGMVLVLNLALVVAGLAAGPLVDAVGPQRTLSFSLALMSAAGLAGWLLPVSYPLLYAVAALQGALFGLATTAMDAYPRFVSADEAFLLRANSLVSSAASVAVIAGPALGALIVSAFPTQADFAVLAFAPLPALALVRATGEKIVPSRPESAAGGGRGFAASLVEGVRVTFVDGSLRLLFLVGFLGFFAYGAFDSLESLFYRDVLHAGAQWMGWLSSIAGVGGTVGSLLAMRVPTRRLNVTTLSLMLLVTGVGSMIYVGTGSIAWACAGQLVTGLGFGAMGPIRTTLTQRYASFEQVGRVISVMRVGMNSAGVLPLLVAPFLADAFGVQAVLFSASTLVALIAVGFVVGTSRGRGSGPDGGGSRGGGSDGASRGGRA
ncbi:MAG: MFS transporter [Parafannyhessea sp.]|uniref:MFS transporter n=1 Tax=Parafannyhessea sp. TaxID=2847324 RepID=UPI003F07B15E